MNATYDPYYHDPGFHFYNKKMAYLPYGVAPLTAPGYVNVPENHQQEGSSPKSNKKRTSPMYRKSKK